MKSAKLLDFEIEERYLKMYLSKVRNSGMTRFSTAIEFLLLILGLYLSRWHKAEFADTLKQIFLCLIDIHCNKKFDNYNQLEMMEELMEYNIPQIKPKVIEALNNRDYLEPEDIQRFRKYFIYPDDLKR